MFVFPGQVSRVNTRWTQADVAVNYPQINTEQHVHLQNKQSCITSTTSPLPSPIPIMSQSEAGDGTTRRSTRNPRRRQRQESESLNNSQPRRKRSKIDNDTFKVPDEAGSVTKQQNGGLTVANGHVHSTRSVRRASVQPEREATAELVVRGAKKTSTKRAARSDGSTVLV